MIFGVDYYPEHWPEERWEEDASLMATLGLEVVRLGEFSWTLLEPKEGEYSFQWLDKVIALLKEQSLKVILCTPTAIPPQWLVKKYPNILPVNQRGLTIGPGSRRHYCVNSPYLREYTEKIVKALGGHYQYEEQVIGWQIDNEFSCHNTTRCYCDSCLKAFQGYLKDKYGDLESLNKAWGTVFWNMIFTSWDEIFLPKLSVTEHNPSLLLDFYQFSSKATIDYLEFQVGLLKCYNSHWFITHNLMGTRVNEIDHFRTGQELSFISWDNYNEEGRSPSLTSMDHDLMRSLKKKPFWVMEQQVGQINWGETNPIPRPGSVALWSKQAVARGCRGIVFFRWRAGLYGQEQYHSGLLKHDGSFSRGWMEVKDLIPSLKALEDLFQENRLDGEVGILFSYKQLFALDIQPYHSSFSYLQHLKAYYQALWEKNIGVDFLSPLEDLSDYKVIIAPTLYVASQEMLDNLSSFVEGGGTLILTLRSGKKDMMNRVYGGPPPGPFRGLSGIRVEEMDSLPRTKGNKVLMDWGYRKKSYQAHTFCEILKGEGAHLLGHYEEDFYKGEGAITLNQMEGGQVIYIGAMMEEDFYLDLVDWLLKTTPLTKPISSPAKVEVVKNLDPKTGKNIYFIFNHNAHKEEISLPGPFLQLETKEIMQGTLSLQPLGAVILKPLS